MDCMTEKERETADVCGQICVDAGGEKRLDDKNVMVYNLCQAGLASWVYLSRAHGRAHQTTDLRRFGRRQTCSQTGLTADG